MAWFKLAGDGAFHAKVLEAGNEAYGAWCRAGQWSSAHLTEGRIPTAVALTIAEANVWQKLSNARAGGEHGLVEEVDGGWQIHDYLDWNPTAAEERAKRAARVSAGKRGGSVRSAKQPHKQTPSKPQANDQAKSNPVSVSVSVSVEDPDQIPPVSVDPVPANNAREKPHPLTEGGRDGSGHEQPKPILVTSSSLAAELARHPGLAPLASDRDAVENLAMTAAVAGMRASEAGEAVAALAQVRAAELPRMGASAQAEALGRFLHNQRKRRAIATKTPAVEPDERVILDEFAELWSAAHGQALPPADGDERHAAKILDLAKRAASASGGNATWQDVARHVIRGYVRDGEKGLVDQAHPLRLLPTRFASYGLPKKRSPRAPPTELPEPPPRPKPTSAVMSTLSGGGMNDLVAKALGDVSKSTKAVS